MQKVKMGILKQVPIFVKSVKIRIVLSWRCKNKFSETYLLNHFKTTQRKYFEKKCFKINLFVFEQNNSQNSVSKTCSIMRRKKWVGKKRLRDH